MSKQQKKAAELLWPPALNQKTADTSASRDLRSTYEIPNEIILVDVLLC
jgi:hypothetical protein